MRVVHFIALGVSFGACRIRARASIAIEPSPLAGSACSRSKQFGGPRDRDECLPALDEVDRRCCDVEPTLVLAALGGIAKDDSGRNFAESFQKLLSRGRG